MCILRYEAGKRYDERTCLFVVVVQREEISALEPPSTRSNDVFKLFELDDSYNTTWLNVERERNRSANTDVKLGRVSMKL